MFVGAFEVFRTCQFTSIGGRVDVKPMDFGLAAKLDPQYGCAIVSIILSQYLTFCPTQKVDTSDAEAVCRNYVAARKLNAKWIESLQEDVHIVSLVNSFAHKMFSVYKVEQSDKMEEAFSKVVDARTHLFGNCGKIC